MKKLLLCLFFLLTACSTQIDYDSEYYLNADYVLKAARFSVIDYVDAMNPASVQDPWARGDNYLVKARLTNNESMYLLACKSFLVFQPKNSEQRAVWYETLASLNCNNKKTYYLKKAMVAWDSVGVHWRADLIRSILAKQNNLLFETSSITPNLSLSLGELLLLGNTSITIAKVDHVLTQTDRVYRDWLGRQLAQNPFEGSFLKTFSERLTYSSEDLRADIGWHEGGRMNDLMNTVKPYYTVATGTVVAKKDGTWYAPDDHGVFRFQVPFDKISYPTTRFLTSSIGVIIDTHGVNMLVEQAIRTKASVVLSDCDHPGKVKAALYLSQQDIKVICFPDRFVHLALGHDVQLVGSPIWRYDENTQSMIYGNTPLTVKKHQKIVVTNASAGPYALWYYTTPMFYFKEIAKEFPLTIIPAVVDDFGQLNTVFSLARAHNAEIVATRVFNKDDFTHAKNWLAKNQQRKLILFHSTMYPYGILLMQQFPNQVSFNDPNPAVI